MSEGLGKVWNMAMETCQMVKNGLLRMLYVIGKESGYFGKVSDGLGKLEDGLENMSDGDKCSREDVRNIIESVIMLIPGRGGGVSWG